MMESILLPVPHRVPYPQRLALTGSEEFRNLAWQPLSSENTHQLKPVP